jgi:RNA polymerase sigma-70 factor, ECF subfamily
MAVAFPPEASMSERTELATERHPQLNPDSRTVRVGGHGFRSHMDEKRHAILAEIPRLRRYARALMRDRDAADDLVQDCLERALSRMDNWRTGDSPRRWLFTIMHNLFIDRKRRLYRRGQTVSLSKDVAESVVTPPSQFESVVSREVMDALQAMAPERREALILVAVEGLAYAEAATVLGIPPGTLMSRVARAREELRALLDDAARRRTIRVVEK